MVKSLPVMQETWVQSLGWEDSPVGGHLAYLTYMKSTSCEILGWMKPKLESRLQGEISITLDTQMIPPLWQRVTSPKITRELKKKKSCIESSY